MDEQTKSTEAFSKKGTAVHNLQIKENQELLRTVVENAPFPIGDYIGREMRILLANSSIIIIWGKGKDVIGKLYSEVLPELHNQNIYRQLADFFLLCTLIQRLLKHEQWLKTERNGILLFTK